MTIRLKVLQYLRIFGPISISDLADRTGLERQAVYATVYKLRTDGLAEHPGPASYDITDQGRAFLACQPADQVVTKQTVRQLDLFE